MQTLGKLSLVCDPVEFSLYVHFPFCKRICPYCHFYVIKAPGKSEDWQEAFIQNLLLDWKLHQNLAVGKNIRSLYFGGGTPSLFSPHHFTRLLDAFYEIFKPAKDFEITLEANPEAISLQYLQNLKKSGINRLSLGVQSLEDHELIRLGRGHQSSKALEAIQWIKDSFESYSLDLMMETPGQTLDSWRHTLDQVIKINPPHLSLYNLVIEPGTAYAKQEKRLRRQMPDLESATQMLTTACDTFESIGLKRYEISAFARPGFESVHNTGYWRGREFIGLGPSAFSFLKGKRLQKQADLNAWADAITQGDPGWGLIDDPPAEVRQAELLAVHLRLTCGVDIERFQQRWGKLAPALTSAIGYVKAIGWLETKDNILLLTDQGRLFYDRLASELMPV